MKLKLKCINMEAIKIGTSEKTEALINAIELSKLQQENAELKKALELACVYVTNINPFLTSNYFIKQANEAQDGNE